MGAMIEVEIRAVSETVTAEPQTETEIVRTTFFFYGKTSRRELGVILIAVLFEIRNSRVNGGKELH